MDTHFVLPLPPSDNQLYFYLPKMGNKRIPTKEFKQWKKEAEYALMPYRRFALKQVKTVNKIVWKMHLICYLEKKNIWKSDLSNRFKLLFDTVSETINIDDRYLTFYQASKESLESAPVRLDLHQNQNNRTIMEQEHVYCRLIVES